MNNYCILLDQNKRLSHKNSFQTTLCPRSPFKNVNFSNLFVTNLEVKILIIAKTTLKIVLHQVILSTTVPIPKILIPGNGTPVSMQ